MPILIFRNHKHNGGQDYPQPPEKSIFLAAGGFLDSFKKNILQHQFLKRKTSLIRQNG